MDSSSIELPGSEIGSIRLLDGCLRVELSRAYMVKTMTGSRERTRWWQSGAIVIEEAEPESALPAGPLICDGGDIDDNIYTYRDMIPLPLDSRGLVRCDLRFRDTDTRLVVRGTRLTLEMADVPKYIEHLRPTE
jgi:hypothetical protein